MLSMTGFGTGQATDPRGEVRVQIASVNNRACQVSLKSDLGDPALEDELRQQVRAALGRGSITVHIQIQPAGGGLDRAGLTAAWTALAALAQELGAPVPTLEEAARVSGGRRESTSWADLVRPALAQALVAVQAARAREGAALLAAFQAQAARLRELHGAIAVRAVVRSDLSRTSLQTRLEEVVGAAVAPEILVRELALYAERIEITEELVRLATHLDALDGLLVAPDPGKRLEFLAQEIGREINTTGAKANDAPLAALVIEAKVVVDQIKEQAANIA